MACIGWLTPASVRAAGVPLADIARGKYLVEQVMLCGDCHTPHDEKGEPIADQTLRGAPLAFKPTVPMPWADKAPNIAGLRGWEMLTRSTSMTEKRTTNSSAQATDARLPAEQRGRDRGRHS